MRILRAKRIATNIIHGIYGFTGAILGYEYLFTAVFMVYQVIDLLCEKSCEEFKRDLIEYAIGLLVGVLVKLYILH